MLSSISHSLEEEGPISTKFPDLRFLRKFKRWRRGLVGKYLGAGGSVGAWTIKVLSDEINKTGNLGHHHNHLDMGGDCAGRLGNKNIL